MDWLRTTAAKRMQPQNMWPDAKRNCSRNELRAGSQPMKSCGADCGQYISLCSRARYHNVLKGKLKQLASQFSAKTGNAVKVFVDTAPLMEKPLAQQAGLGGRVNIQTLSQDRQDLGCFWALFSPMPTVHAFWRPIIVEAVVNVLISAQQMHFRHLIGWMRDVAFPMTIEHKASSLGNFAGRWQSHFWMR